MSGSKSRTFRQLLERSGLLLRPCCYDAHSVAYTNAGADYIYVECPRRWTVERAGESVC